MLTHIKFGYITDFMYFLSIRYYSFDIFNSFGKYIFASNCFQVVFFSTRVASFRFNCLHKQLNRYKNIFTSVNQMIKSFWGRCNFGIS